jgi:hypothetical protein
MVEEVWNIKEAKLNFQVFRQMNLLLNYDDLTRKVRTILETYALCGSPVDFKNCKTHFLILRIASLF